MGVWLKAVLTKLENLHSGAVVCAQIARHPCLVKLGLTVVVAKLAVPERQGDDATDNYGLI